MSVRCSPATSRTARASAPSDCLDAVRELEPDLEPVDQGLRAEGDVRRDVGSFDGPARLEREPDFEPRIPCPRGREHEQERERRDGDRELGPAQRE